MNKLWQGPALLLGAFLALAAATMVATTPKARAQDGALPAAEHVTEAIVVVVNDTDDVGVVIVTDKGATLKIPAAECTDACQALGAQLVAQHKVHFLRIYTPEAGAQSQSDVPNGHESHPAPTPSSGDPLPKTAI